MIKYLSSEEVIKQLHISKPTLYRWVNSKKIPYVRRGHRLLFDEQQIKEWIEITNPYKEESFLTQLNRA